MIKFSFFIIPYSSVSFISWASLLLKTEKSSFTHHRSGCFAVSVAEDLGIEQQLERNALGGVHCWSFRGEGSACSQGRPEAVSCCF